MTLARKYAKGTNENYIGIMQRRIILPLFNIVNIYQALIVSGSFYQFIHIFCGLHFYIEYSSFIIIYIYIQANTLTIQTNIDRVFFFRVASTTAQSNSCLVTKSGRRIREIH